MNMKVRKQGETGKVTLDGELTIYTAQAIQAKLKKPLGECNSLELNLQGVTELDSAGVQVLIAAKRAARAAGKTLSLCQHSEAVVEVFELMNIAHEFGDPIVLSERVGR